MTRPTPDSPFPYSRGVIATMTGVSVPTIKNLQHGRVLRKRRRGSGHHHGYSLDDALRIMLSKELLRVGLQVSSIQSLFDSLESPPSSGRPWAWLRTSEARTSGAALVLLHGHPLGPDPATHGNVYLTTAAEAVTWLTSKRAGLTVIVIDVGALILQLEERTGEHYNDQPPDRAVPHGQQQ